MQDPYLYIGTETLINLFDERNENRLKEILQKIWLCYGKFILLERVIPER